ncbi:beta-lactamase class A [Thermoflexibacter ruber]|uniref:beta-lactamase n=2 Tax=Thermoflexibacter ruber TaxID=1003 RepID=A0A1I2JAG5_9BACT|nr:beta-lactamase class A [Thermoflexibacter ruber]
MPNNFPALTKILLSLLFLITSCEPKHSKMNDLKKQIQAKFASIKGEFALAYKDLDNPSDTLFINAFTDFHAASTMKTAVMLEVFKQAQEGKFALTDSLTLKNEFKSIVDSSAYSLDVADDSEEVLYSSLGQKRTIYQLVYEMITVSSNLATNMLIEIVGAENVTQTLHSLGINQMKVLRGVEDSKAFGKGMNNTVTAYDLALLLEKIAMNQVLNVKACEEMRKILLNQKFNDVIPALLPQEVKVAHKTGTITGVHHDSAIVYLPNGKKYVLVLLSRKMEDFDKGTKMLSEVSKLIYEYAM